MRNLRLGIAALALLSANFAWAGQPPSHEVWVCSAENFPQKYIIDGNKMTAPFLFAKELLGSSDAGLMDQQYEIVQNNRYGVIAIKSEAKSYSSGEPTKNRVVVSASVLMLLKRGNNAAILHEWSAEFPSMGTRTNDKTSDQSCVRDD